MALHRDLITTLFRSFENIAHREGGTEFWLARELQELLGYSKWSATSSRSSARPARLARTPATRPQTILPTSARWSTWAPEPSGESRTWP